MVMVVDVLRFLQGVLFEGGARFRDVYVAADVVQRQHLDAAA